MTECGDACPESCELKQGALERGSEVAEREPVEDDGIPASDDDSRRATLQERIPSKPILPHAEGEAREE